VGVNLFFKIVAVELRDPQGAKSDANFVVNHQLGQSISINKDDALDGVGKIYRLGGETRGGDKHPFGGFLSCQGSVKLLKLRPTDSILPAFGLDLDFLQSQFVQGNDAVDAAVTRATYPPKIGATSAVT